MPMLLASHGQVIKEAPLEASLKTVATCVYRQKRNARSALTVQTLANDSYLRTYVHALISLAC